MARKSLTLRLVSAIAAAALVPMTPPAWAQDAVTTVAPLTATALAPIPLVGVGASWFTPDELKSAAAEARNFEIDAKAASRQCRQGGAPSTEAFGDYNFEALYDTESIAQGWRSRAAQAAEAAAEAALAARAAAARGEGTEAALQLTELTRQDAVREYQLAQVATREAQRRIADLQDLLETADGGIAQVRAQADARSLARGRGLGPGDLYLPDEYKDLKIEDVAVRRTGDAGAEAMRVAGAIVNTRRHAIIVPPLWVAAVDHYGTAVKTQMMVAPPKTPNIAVGGRAAFNLELSPLPENAERAVVTFAPFHHEPQYKPVSAFCDL